MANPDIPARDQTLAAPETQYSPNLVGGWGGGGGGGGQAKYLC